MVFTAAEAAYRDDPSSSEPTGQDASFCQRNPKRNEGPNFPTHTPAQMCPHCLPPACIRTTWPLQITRHLQTAPRPGWSQQGQPGPSKHRLTNAEFVRKVQQRCRESYCLQHIPWQEPGRIPTTPTPSCFLIELLAGPRPERTLCHLS